MFIRWIDDDAGTWRMMNHVGYDDGVFMLMVFMSRMISTIQTNADMWAMSDARWLMQRCYG